MNNDTLILYAAATISLTPQNKNVLRDGFVNEEVSFPRVPCRRLGIWAAISLKLNCKPLIRQLPRAHGEARFSGSLELIPEYLRQTIFKRLSHKEICYIHTFSTLIININILHVSIKNHLLTVARVCFKIQVL